MSSKKKELRSAKTFPKTYEGLINEVVALMEKEYFVLPLDTTVVHIGKSGDPDDLDAVEVIVMMEDEYGVYLDDFCSVDKSYTIRDIIDNLAEKIGVEKDE